MGELEKGQLLFTRYLPPVVGIQTPTEYDLMGTSAFLSGIAFQVTCPYQHLPVPISTCPYQQPPLLRSAVPKTELENPEMGHVFSSVPQKVCLTGTSAFDWWRLDSVYYFCSDPFHFLGGAESGGVRDAFQQFRWVITLKRTSNTTSLAEPVRMGGFLDAMPWFAARPGYLKWYTLKPNSAFHNLLHCCGCFFYIQGRILFHSQEIDVSLYMGTVFTIFRSNFLFLK